jgi:hypothetical protein
MIHIRISPAALDRRRRHLKRDRTRRPASRPHRQPAACRRRGDGPLCQRQDAPRNRNGFHPSDAPPSRRTPRRTHARASRDRCGTARCPATGYARRWVRPERGALARATRPRLPGLAGGFAAKTVTASRSAIRTSHIRGGCSGL